MRLEIASDSRKGNILHCCQMQCTETDFCQLLSLSSPHTRVHTHPPLCQRTELAENLTSARLGIMIAQMLQCKQCPDPAPPLNFINPWLSAFLPCIGFFFFRSDNLFFPLWAEVAPGALKRNWRAAPPLYIGCCSQFNLIKILPVVEFILLRSCFKTRWQRFLFCSAWSSLNLFSLSSCMYLFLIDSSPLWNTF